MPSIEARSINAKPGAGRLFRAFVKLGVFAFRADPRRMAGMSTLLVLTNFGGPITALAIKQATDAVVARDTRAALQGVTAVIAIQVVTEALSWIATSLRMGLRERVGRALDKQLIDLAMGIPGIEHYERPDYQDELQLLRWQRDHLSMLPDAVVSNLALLARMASTIALLTAVDGRLGALPLFGIPAVLLVVRTERRRRRVQEQVVQRRRLTTRLFRIASEVELAKEVRLFGLGDELMARQLRLRDETNREQTRAEALSAAESAAGWLVFAAGFLFAAVVVVSEAMQGRATIGEVVLVLSLSRQINEQMTGAINLVSWTLQCASVGARYLWLVDYADRAAAMVEPDAPDAPPQRIQHGIDFVGISFKYPGTDVDALVDVDLRLPAGSTLAIVGENGAGKSTLVKLLFRMYEPDEGAILVDGVPLRDIDLRAWRGAVSAGFQDFCRFELHAREAVGVGDIRVLDDDAADIDLDLVAAEALGRAGSTELLDDLPNGWDTQLGRSFDDGIELSGGQWQKVAVARSMMRTSPLVLALDEPTSALDPYTEHKLFEQFADVGRRVGAEVGAITVLVSHRFSTVRMASKIVVVDAGRIVESGTHDELMNLGGLYAELYQLQARAYA